MICLTLTEPTLEKNLAVLKRYRDYIGLAELRADWLDPDQLSRLGEFPARAALPVILTIRRKIDGGRWEGSEKERLSLYRRQIERGYSYFDLEEDLPEQEWESRWLRRGSTIRSFHDFEGTPDDLAARILSLPRGAGDPQRGGDAPFLPRLCPDISGRRGDPAAVGGG